MAYFYDNNSAPYYSEAYANTTGPNSLDIGTDWTIDDVNTLSLWFHGIPDLTGHFDYNDVNNGTYKITADGSGLKGAPCEEDSFYFVYKDVAYNNGQVIARVNSVECGMAGVMIRDSLGSKEIKYGAVFVTADKRVVYQRRESIVGTPTPVTPGATVVSDITLPHWVRIRCVAGVTWTASRGRRLKPMVVVAL
jgi:hypothetical protein